MVMHRPRIKFGVNFPSFTSKAFERGEVAPPEFFGGGNANTMMVLVYVLQSQSSGRFYVGITRDLPRRLDEHTRGQSRASRGRGPWKLLYSETCDDYVSARKRERFFKSGPGHAFLKNAGVA